MIPISDDNPTLRTPWVTYGLLGTLALVWLFVQGAGFNPEALARTVCNLGLVPGELTGRAQLGEGFLVSHSLACLVDAEPINWLTPVISMFLHAGWGHLVGNGLFLWVFGNNVEDSMGRVRFIFFYLLCGLAAAATQVAIDPSSPIPMVGASGAISGVLGAYLVLYPRVRVNMLFILLIFIRVIPLPAYVVLLWWFGWQVIAGLPQLTGLSPEAGVAFWAHIGGFVAGVAMVKLFENPALVRERQLARPWLRARQR